jgi:hypothetical protein
MSERQKFQGCYVSLLNPQKTSVSLIHTGAGANWQELKLGAC